MRAAFALASDKPSLPAKRTQSSTQPIVPFFQATARQSVPLETVSKAALVKRARHLRLHGNSLATRGHGDGPPARTAPCRTTLQEARARHRHTVGSRVMKALVWHGKEDIRYDTVSDPEIEVPRDAIIKVTSCAICGSDLHLFHNFIPP